MPWLPYKLRDADVWAKVDARGELAADSSGRVDVLYQPKADAKVYRASARNLVRRDGEPIDLDASPVVSADAVPAGARGVAASAQRERSPAGATPARADAVPVGARGVAASAQRERSPAGATPARADAVYVWTDGACTGNPGPAGLGVVVIEDGERSELSEFLGDATNNIAELTAIERGLELVKKRERLVLVHSDSAYAIGLLSQNWKAKANVELVMRLRELAAGFPDVRYVKVKGHAGVPENERCDQLAREAILKRR